MKRDEKAISFAVQEKALSDQKLLEIIKNACHEAEGDCGVLESAVGALCWGRVVGWHGLRTMHSSRTMKRYEKYLRIKSFKTVLPARTEHSIRMYGIVLADKFKKFWQAISGGLVPAGKAKRIVEM